MKIEDLEKRVEKRVVEIKHTPSEMKETFELRLSHKQAEQLAERGFLVYCTETKYEWVDRPVRSYFTEVNTEDLLKLLPRK
jgi:hypothetical protein